MENQRDNWLKADDKLLMADCVFDPFKATGKGGQKRNKTSSAVRLTHSPTGIIVTASDSRSQHDNRRHALKKLRRELAIQIRVQPAAKVEQLEMSTSNPAFPLWIASILDMLTEHNFSVKEVASAFDISTSRFIKLLAKDDQVWQEVNRLRLQHGLSQLSK